MPRFAPKITFFYFSFSEIFVALESQSGIPIKYQTLLSSDGNRITTLEQFRSVPVRFTFFS